MSRRGLTVSASPTPSQPLKPLGNSSYPKKAKRKAGEQQALPQPTAEQLAATSFLATYQSSVAASTALLSSLSSQTAAALTAASDALMQTVERRRRERETADLRRESRMTRHLQEEEWRAEQEHEILLRCVEGRREEERRRERQRQQSELERDRRCYQQQQELFEREVQRMREQEEAELERERQEEKQRCSQRMRRVVLSIVAVAQRRRLWSELTERAEVEPELWEDWMQLMRKDSSTVAASGCTATQVPQAEEVEAETAGDGLNAALTSTASPPAPAASVSSPQPALSPPQTATQPAPSPSNKKGRGDRKEEKDAVAVAPPVKTLVELRQQHRDLLDLHRHAHSTALGLREADAGLLDTHFASSYLSSSSSSSSSDASDTPTFSALLQHVEAKATAPPLPVALPFLPYFPIRLALLGKPYSGKRTQAARLAAHYNLSVIALADVIASQPELQQLLASSSPLPEALLVSLVAARIAALPASCSGFLLLSFPSSLSLARLLSLHTPWPLTAVLELRVGEEPVRRRCLARCIDAQGREWNREENSADADSLGKAELRPADRGERLMKHCRQYEREREAMLDWWTAAGNRREVDGEGCRDDVFSALCEQVEIRLSASPPPPPLPPPSPFAPLQDMQLARLLWSQHQRAAAAYGGSLSVFSSSLRQLRIAVLDRLHTARLCLRRLLHCESRADQWRWQQQEAANGEEEEEGEQAAEAMDAAWKEEQHVRADEAGRRLRDFISSRRSDWEQELQDVRSDGWELSMRATLLRCHVRMMQAEADCLLAAIRLTRDFFRSRAGRTLQEDDRGDPSRYTLQAGLQPRRQQQKEEKLVAGAGKDKAGSKKAAAGAAPAPEDAARDAAPDPLGDAVRQCEAMQGEAREAALQGLQGDDERELQQAQAVLASLCSDFSCRVQALEQRGRAALAALEAEVARVMSALEAEARQRWEQEEAEATDWLRWLLDRVEAEEQPVWEVRRRQATQPGLLVDKTRRLQRRRPEVLWSVWESRQRAREAEAAADRQKQADKHEEEEAKQQVETTVEEVETANSAGSLVAV